MFSLSRTTTLLPSLKRSFSTSPRSLAGANTLVFLETKDSKLVPSTFNTITAAKKLGGKVHGVLIGKDQQEVESCAGVAKK